MELKKVLDNTKAMNIAKEITKLFEPPFETYKIFEK